MKILYCFENNKYTIKLLNSNDEMQMSFEGMDFYFTMFNYHNNNQFIIDKDNELYIYFEHLFIDIKKNDKPYDKMLNDNQFVWLSESYGEYKDANKLSITRTDESFIIQFYNNSNKIFGNSKICPICFCLSGSKNQNIANVFAIMFNNIIIEKYGSKKIIK